VADIISPLPEQELEMGVIWMWLVLVFLLLAPQAFAQNNQLV